MPFGHFENIEICGQIPLGQKYVLIYSPQFSPNALLTPI